MDIFSILSVLGGLAFFLYGMRVMSEGLKRLAGSRLEVWLSKMTDRPMKGLALGALVTAAIQSSSAVTVMLVSLVNSKIMSFGASVPVIMGSNVGTTLTAWLLSLSGIEGGGFLLRLLKPESFSPILALVGVILLTASKNQSRRQRGGILVGFAILMEGMSIMSSSLSPLAESESFREVLLWFTNPLLGILAGAIFTGVIQSSSASVGILQALSLTGRVSYSVAFPIILGQNIGTCVTALLSCIGADRNGRRVAAVHVLFNLIGSMAALIPVYGLDLVFNFAFFDRSATPAGIALMHTLFNLSTTVLLFPIRHRLGELASRVVGERRNASKLAKNS